jgi:hypothetical protein
MQSQFRNVGGLLLGFFAWCYQAGRNNPMLSWVAVVSYAIGTLWILISMLTSGPQRSNAVQPQPQAQQNAPQVMAQRNGELVTIQWNAQITEPEMFVEGKGVPANCNASACNILVPLTAQKIEARWQQGGQAFQKVFYLVSGTARPTNY